MKIFIVVYTAIFLTVSFIMSGAGAGKNPIEAGSVSWGRHLDSALKTSMETGRPILILFQEIPGCGGCQLFGRTVLTNLLLVEAIEDEFLPVLVYNNRNGKDKELLQQYREPAWNFQVIRFLNAEGNDIIPRKERVWTTQGVAIRMIQTLKVLHRPVPKYLETVAMENDIENQSSAAFAVPCFWSGEVALGRIDGVIKTEAGFIENHEVTRVVYDKEKISLQELADKAKNCSALKVYIPDSDRNDLTGIAVGRLDDKYRKANKSDQKKQLQLLKTIYELPGLTEMQKTKINAFINMGRDIALEWLSPKQKEVLNKSEL